MFAFSTAHLCRGYACLLVEDFTREGLVDAMRRRHTYAATDSIILDVRMNGALMGDVIDADTAPKLEVTVIGTAPVAQIDAIKNNIYVLEVAPGTAEASFEYVDADSKTGESYYYVRVP